MGLIDGLISAGAQIWSTKQQADIAKENTDKTNRANRELAEYQYSKDLEMWNKGNTYNSPVAQMERLKNAGLNPNLIYGSGGATTQASQLPKYNAPTMSYNYRPAVDPLAIIGAYQDFRIKQAQADNLEANTPLIEAKDVLTKYKGYDARLEYGSKSGWNGARKDGELNEYQKFQQDYRAQKLRLGEESILSAQKQREVANQNMKLTQLDIDNYITQMWSKLIFGGAGAIAKFK